MISTKKICFQWNCIQQKAQCKAHWAFCWMKKICQKIYDLLSSKASILITA